MFGTLFYTTQYVFTSTSLEHNEQNKCDQNVTLVKFKMTLRSVTVH